VSIIAKIVTFLENKQFKWVKFAKRLICGKSWSRFCNVV